jgi:hypothetical protein
MMRLFTVIFLLFGYTQPVFAEDSELVFRFREAALNAVARVEARGETELQNISLSEIKQVIQSAQVVHYPNVSVRIGNRRCARWQPGTTAMDMRGEQVNIVPHIYLNKACTDLVKDELEGVALHEFLGLGFGADKDYEITSQVLSGGVKKSHIFDTKKAAEIKRQLQNSRSGGSTGVGGGGDEYDLRFKLAGLRYLQNIEDPTLLGIPLEILEYIVREMRVSPAQDIDHLLEFRSAGVEGARSSAIIYVESSLYREKNPNLENLGLLAVTAAQVFATYAAADLGLSEVGPFIFSKERQVFMEKITRLRLK